MNPSLLAEMKCEWLTLTLAPSVLEIRLSVSKAAASQRFASSTASSVLIGQR